MSDQSTVMSSINADTSNTGTTASNLFSSTSTKRGVPDEFGDKEHRSKRGGEERPANSSELEDGEILEDADDERRPNTATSSQEGSASTVHPTNSRSVFELLVERMLTLRLASEVENLTRPTVIQLSDGTELYLQPLIAPYLTRNGCVCGFCGQDGENQEDEKEELNEMTDDDKTEDGHQGKA